MLSAFLEPFGDYFIPLTQNLPKAFTNNNLFDDGEIFKDSEKRLSKPATSWKEQWRCYQESMQSSNTIKAKKTRTRVKTKVSIHAMPKATFLSEEEIDRETYLTSIKSIHGIGLELIITYDGQIIVNGVGPLKSGMPSPAQLCGKISKGDRLIKVNSTCVESLDFISLTDLVKSLDTLAKNVSNN